MRLLIVEHLKQPHQVRRDVEELGKHQEPRRGSFRETRLQSSRQVSLIQLTLLTTHWFHYQQVPL